MKKIKIDRYFIAEKGRRYEILKFPFIKHMWTIDEPDEREGYFSVHGCKEAFCQIRYAFVILANFPDKIIYFPCKQEEIGENFVENFHLVMCRPELQFKRSLKFLRCTRRQSR